MIRTPKEREACAAFAVLVRRRIDRRRHTRTILAWIAVVAAWALLASTCAA